MDYPKINLTLLQKLVAGYHWCLELDWMELCGLTIVPGRYITPDLSVIDIDNIWDYIQTLEGFTEPDCLTARVSLSQTTLLSPMISQMSCLTALDLDCVKATHVQDWLIRTAFTATQLQQLKHVSLNVSGCRVHVAALSHWLQQMPNLHSFTLVDDSNANWGNGTLIIPPKLTELRQLAIHCHLPTHQLDLGVLPALTRLSIRCGTSENDSPWFPNLKQMTALHSLTWDNLYPKDLVQLSPHLPLQLEQFTAKLARWDKKRDLSSVWTDLMKLSQLFTLDIHKMIIPAHFLEWMKTSKLNSIPVIHYYQRHLGLLLADVIPAMSHLQSLRIGCFCKPRESGRREVARMINLVRQCTQITRLDLDIPCKDIPRFVPILEGLTNLVELRLNADEFDEEWEMPSDFSLLYFPHLTVLHTNMLIALSDLDAFRGWLERHSRLEELHLNFQVLAFTSALAASRGDKVGDMECLEANYQKVSDLLFKCTTTTALTSLDVDFTVDSQWFPHFVPHFLPDDHMLSHFGGLAFPNNIRRHATLFQLLQPDWLEYFYKKMKPWEGHF